MDTRKRILIVDDELVIRKLVTESLLGSYEVFVLSSDRHFMDTVEDIKPDLVILDVRLPGLSGIQLCRHLRGQRRFAGIPVLFLSALTRDVDAIAGFNAGGNSYLGKPFDVGTLRQTVEALTSNA